MENKQKMREIFESENSDNVVEILNKNLYGVVYLIEIEGKRYVIKKIKQNQRKIKYLNRQKKVCQKVQNQQFFVKIHDVWLRDSHLYIRMDYYETSLEQFIKKQWAKLENNPAIAFKLFLQILFALTQLRYMHRDIKPENIFIKCQNDNLRIYLADFGQCSTGQVYNKSYVGTLGYQSPQLISYRWNHNVKYDRKSDIWSLGTILFQLYCGFNKSKFKQQNDLIFPWKEQLPKQLQQLEDFYQKQVMNSFISIKKSVPFFIRQLIRKMLKVNPQERISYMEIYEFINQQMPNIAHYFAQSQLGLWQSLLKKYQKKQTQNEIFYKSQKKCLQSFQQLYKHCYIPLKNIKIHKQYFKILQLIYYNIQHLLFLLQKLIKQYQLSQKLINQIIPSQQIDKIKLFCIDLGNKIGYMIDKNKLMQQRNIKYVAQCWASTRVRAIVKEYLENVEEGEYNLGEIYTVYVNIFGDEGGRL